MHRKKTIIPILIIIFFSVSIISDIIFDCSADYPIEILFYYASLLGIVSLFFFALAGLFFVSRITYTLIAKRSLLPKSLMPTFQRHILVVKKIHPTIGAVAISLSLLHGYILFFRIFPFETDSDITSGFFVLGLYILTGISGLLVIFKAYDRSIRHIHRIIASITAFLILIHWGFVTFFN